MARWLVLVRIATHVSRFNLGNRFWSGRLSMCLKIIAYNAIPVKGSVPNRALGRVALERRVAPVRASVHLRLCMRVWNA